MDRDRRPMTAMADVAPTATATMSRASMRAAAAAASTSSARLTAYGSAADVGPPILLESLSPPSSQWSPGDAYSYIPKHSQ